MGSLYFIPPVTVYTLNFPKLEKIGMDMLFTGMKITQDLLLSFEIPLICFDFLLCATACALLGT